MTLGTVPPGRWDGVARDGFDFLFLMGVWRRSPLGRELALSDRGLTQEVRPRSAGLDARGCRRLALLYPGL